jgi:hypothetical protein
MESLKNQKRNMGMEAPRLMTAIQLVTGRNIVSSTGSNEMMPGY